MSQDGFIVIIMHFWVGQREKEDGQVKNYGRLCSTIVIAHNDNDIILVYCPQQFFLLPCCFWLKIPPENVWFYLNSGKYSILQYYSTEQYKHTVVFACKQPRASPFLPTFRYSNTHTEKQKSTQKYGEETHLLSDHLLRWEGGGQKSKQATLSFLTRWKKKLFFRTYYQKIKTKGSAFSSHCYVESLSIVATSSFSQTGWEIGEGEREKKERGGRKETTENELYHDPRVKPVHLSSKRISRRDMLISILALYRYIFVLYCRTTILNDFKGDFSFS